MFPAAVLALPYPRLFEGSRHRLACIRGALVETHVGDYGGVAEHAHARAHIVVLWEFLAPPS